MKKNLFLFPAIIIVSALSAQATPQKGDFQANVGLGFSSVGTPINLSVDYGVGKNISVGGGLTYVTDTNTYSGGKYKHTGFGVTAHGNYHFNKILSLPNNIDFYAGLYLGYYNWNSKVEDSFNGINTAYSGSTYNSGLFLSAQVGGRYFFTKNWAANLELGGGTYSGGKIGITYRFDK